jgi:hypothetical protein
MVGQFYNIWNNVDCHKLGLSEIGADDMREELRKELQWEK